MWRAWVCLRPQSAQTKLFLISNTLCPCHSCCDSAVQLGNVACCSFWEVSRVIVHVSSWTIRSRLLVCLTPARPLAVDCELSLCETPLIWPASLHCLTACLSSKWKTWQWWQSALKIRIISTRVSRKKLFFKFCLLLLTSGANRWGEPPKKNSKL